MKSIYKGHRVAIWSALDESWQEVTIIDMHIEGNIAFYLVKNKQGEVYSKQISSADEIRPAKPARVHKIKKPKLKLIS